MRVCLVRANRNDAEEIWRIQREAFAELLERYQDMDTNPGNEPLEKIIMRMGQPFTHYYFIQAEQATVGVIRVIDSGVGGQNKRISPLMILPEYRGQGIAQEAIRQAEQLHGGSGWELDTILQEKGNCHLYEKMGYHTTGKTEVINERLTLVFYEK